MQDELRGGFREGELIFHENRQGLKPVFLLHLTARLKPRPFKAVRGIFQNYIHGLQNYPYDLSRLLLLSDFSVRPSIFSRTLRTRFPVSTARGHVRWLRGNLCMLRISCPRLAYRWRRLETCEILILSRSTGFGRAGSCARGSGAPCASTRRRTNDRFRPRANIRTSYPSG